MLAETANIDTINVVPDWALYVKTLNEAKAELMSLGLEFKGTGFYLSNTDTLLIVPNYPIQPKIKAEAGMMWKEQPEQVLYDIYCWNCSFKDTIFAVCAAAPVRDQRS